ncbi:MAG: hypothetical protein ACREUC_15395, partial [Steroidobacteraceae bacterium]
AETWSRVRYTDLDVTLDDLRAALDWLSGNNDSRVSRLAALAVRVFNDNARHDEALEWIDSALRLPDIDPDIQVGLHAARASALMSATRYEEAAAAATSAIQIAAPTPELVTAYYCHALVVFGRDPSRSETISSFQRTIDELASMFSESESARLRSLGQTLCGEIALVRGDAAEARRLLEAQSDHLDRPSALALAVAYVITGNPTLALHLLSEGRKMPGPHLFSHLFSAHEVHAYAALGDYQSAIASAERCERELADFSAFNGEPDLLTTLGAAAYCCDDLIAASTLLEAALRAGGLHAHGTFGLWRWLARSLEDRLELTEREAARTAGAEIAPARAIAHGIKVLEAP